MSSLVVYGSTGRHVTFTKSDLVVPSHDALVAKYGDAGAHFVEKQWSSIASFWMTRVLKDAKLQQSSVSDIIQRVEDDAAARFSKRKEQQQLHKKRKRLLENTDPERGAGLPSTHILISNFVELRVYLTDKPTSDAVIEAMLDACRETAGGDKASSPLAHELLVDTDGLPPPQPSTDSVKDDGKELDPPAASKRRLETLPVGDHQVQAAAEEPDHAPTIAAGTSAGLAFDDRVALVVRCHEVIDAATIVAKLHGKIVNGRAVLCRFFHP